MPELLGLRLGSESVMDPLDFAKLSAGDPDDSAEGPKIGEKGRFKSLGVAMRED